MSKIRLHGSSSGYTEIAPVAASGNNTLTLPNDGTNISHDGNGAVGVTSITVGTGVTIGDGKITCDWSALTSINAAQLVGVCTSGLTKTGGFGGTNTPAFSAYLSNDSDQSISDSTSTKIQFDAERFDTAGGFDTSNYKYTVPAGQGGKYLLIMQAKCSCSTQNTIVGSSLTLKINGSTSFSTGYTGAGYISGTQYNILGNQLNLSCVKELSASDYLEGFGFIKVSSGTPKIQEADDLGTFFMGFKLIE